MSELLVNYPDRAPERLPLGRLRITIGRSARNDVCVPDPFASRVHAGVRREGDNYVLQDLGSANGTYYNRARPEGTAGGTQGGRARRAGARATTTCCKPSARPPAPITTGRGLSSRWRSRTAGASRSARPR